MNGAARSRRHAGFRPGRAGAERAGLPCRMGAPRARHFPRDERHRDVEHRHGAACARAYPAGVLRRFQLLRKMAARARAAGCHMYLRRIPGFKRPEQFWSARPGDLRAPHAAEPGGAGRRKGRLGRAVRSGQVLAECPGSGGPGSRPTEPRVIPFQIASRRIETNELHSVPSVPEWLMRLLRTGTPYLAAKAVAASGARQAKPTDTRTRLPSFLILAHVERLTIGLRI